MLKPSPTLRHPVFGGEARRPRAAILYHYFYPDDVVSARHYADLAEGLRDRGWDVEVWTSNRACRDESVCYPSREVWRGIRIHRIRKPRFTSGSPIGTSFQHHMDDRCLDVCFVEKASRLYGCCNHWHRSAAKYPHCLDRASAPERCPVCPLVF
jgi:hypothetical protein